MVLMKHVALDHIGDCFEPAVRMGRETGNIVLGLVGAEFVQHQERVQTDVLMLAK